MTAPSLRWTWCTGCGCWEKPGKTSHHLMYCTYSEPTASNFEGTAEELARFLAARALVEEDNLLFEQRVSERMGAGS